MNPVSEVRSILIEPSISRFSLAWDPAPYCHHFKYLLLSACGSSVVGICFPVEDSNTESSAKLIADYGAPLSTFGQKMTLPKRVFVVWNCGVDGFGWLQWKDGTLWSLLCWGGYSFDGELSSSDLSELWSEPQCTCFPHLEHWHFNLESLSSPGNGCFIWLLLEFADRFRRLDWVPLLFFWQLLLFADVSVALPDTAFKRFRDDEDFVSSHSLFIDALLSYWTSSGNSSLVVRVPWVAEAFDAAADKISTACDSETLELTSSRSASVHSGSSIYSPRAF